ncbi:DUF2280 domain-containing protein [Acinetobacter thermotolerans]|uniref:DUF2280 domain-containing protein n=1 Tax=Acinetobacter thermotolerans TaxID=3151487 RepID=UPI00325BEF62
MARLNKEQKLYIVRSLAVFNTPKETADLIKQEFDGLAVTPQQCEAYDPTKRTGQNLSEDLKKEFEATRKDFLEKPQNIPIANKAVRLQMYQNLAVRNSKNTVMLLKILEQAAKEEGNQYTNRQEITGKDGKPLQTTVVQATQDQINEAIKKAQEEY